ncbi:RolB family protein [Agrobacterium tumefaciens]|uniref:RolB family protein n=1 Tax=Agrobacterium tumefaciens TaxID=358 RepID=UPI001572CA13
MIAFSQSLSAKEGELKSEIAAMYLRFPFPHPLEMQPPVYPEVICSNAKPIYIYSSRDAVLSYVQSGDVCRFGKTNVFAYTLAPYQSEVSIKTVRHLFKCLRRENCFGDDSGEGDLSHFVAILPTTSFRDGPRAGRRIVMRLELREGGFLLGMW